MATNTDRLAGEFRGGRPWPDEINVHPIERTFSVGLGLSLALFGLLRRGLTGAGMTTLGGALIHRGLTGHCPLYANLRLNTAHGVRAPSASVAHGRGIRVKQVLTIHRPVAEVYRFWRRLSNLPQFMQHLESVEELDLVHSRWRVHGPLDSVISWEAEIINEVEGELIAWRSLPGSLVASAGSVRFQSALGELGTRIAVTLEYDPPAGAVGAALARLLGVDPERQVAADLQRLKILLEGGEGPQLGAQWRGKLSEFPDLESAREVLQTDVKTEGDSNR